MLPVELGEVLRRGIDSRVADVWTAFPAKVLSYDADNQVADLEPKIRRPLPTDDGTIEFEDLPVLPNVPIRFPRGGGDQYAITWPLQAGDWVDVTVETYSSSGWRQTGETGDPLDVRAHNLSSVYARPGASPNTQKLAGANDPDNALVLDAPLIKLIRGASEFVALANLVRNELDAIKTTLGTGTTPVGGGTVTFGTPYVPGNVAATKVKAV